MVVCTFCAFDALSAGRLGLEPITDGSQQGLFKTNVEGPMVLVQTKTLPTRLAHIYGKRLVIF